MTEILKGSTDQSVFVELVDSTTGLPKTGIVHTDVTGSYVRTRSARVAITMASLASASAAHSDGGFILVDDTNQPGVYRFDIPDAAFATGAKEVIVTVKATGCRTVSRLFDLVDLDNQTPILSQFGLNDGNLDEQLGDINGAVTTGIPGLIIGLNDLSSADIVSALGTGSWATAIPWNAAWDAEVQSECTDALNAYDPPTNTELEARTLVAASYATATNQTKTNDRLGFLLAGEFGAISDAQTATETYVIVIDGDTFTADCSGLDATGNRSTTTLTKS